MQIKECREQLGLTQDQMVGVLKGVCPKMDVSLLSKIENGICEPSKDVMEYVEKVLASSCDERKCDDKVILPKELQKLLNQVFYRLIYGLLKTSSRQHPVTRTELAKATKCDDRTNRRGIAELRKAGLPIISSSSHYGYWLADSDQEERMLVSEYRHRAYELLKTASAIENSKINQVEI